LTSAVQIHLCSIYIRVTINMNKKKKKTTIVTIFFSRVTGHSLDHAVTETLAKYFVFPVRVYFTNLQPKVTRCILFAILLQLLLI